MKTTKNVDEKISYIGIESKFHFMELYCGVVSSLTAGH